MEKDLQRSLELLRENVEEVRNDAEAVLSSICQNILSYPDDKQHREVRLDDPLVIAKLLPALGAIECLFDVGFIEATDCLSLPQETPLTKLQTLQKLLNKSTVPRTPVVARNKLYDLLPAACTAKESKFFKSIIGQFESVLRYEDAELQEKAKKLIPIVDLEIVTMTRIRQLQKHAKFNQIDAEKEIDDVKDLFLMELLHWFKYKFFTWVDSPKCTACFSECNLQEVVRTDDLRCSRTEIHKCTKCGTRVKFPRYTDPEPLLILRRGRCGEWANTFTLLCRALGYDARFVHDETDHVWTEVWSIREKRWIHLDPCEDVMDRPLMYEKGWKKKLSYIMAFSKDEVQDVTWRYTRDQKAVMKRRNICSEAKLLQFIESLNRHRQCSPNYSAARRQYVIKRRLLELAELIHVPSSKQNPKDDESYHGRTTGSYHWRQTRGEISETAAKHVWDISKYGDAFRLRYSIVKDAYKVTNIDSEVLMDMSGWQNGVYEVEGGMRRKEEHDWKMVYLSRSPGSALGKVKWCFLVKDPNLCVRTFDLKASVQVFFEADVSWELEAIFDNEKRDQSIVLPIDAYYHTDQLKGSVKLILTATLSGGTGDCAWQHAQLFRQSLAAGNDCSLSVDIRLENR
ncbi:peptide-N(4)-(N-acetyl-beta-glucosaminyl)asparagine amidase [Ceratina calcarata]|uniref:Peptide-N(4)-(N-acetyl-beta-glucosaminyl)asparagine amidase n=1 Tax=Ceratina calcarata TaxID=156304 RepID=A0AAJ7JH34_9HYME|nr:peptide-N(4)-(N-acetyl-beta-glucosaminyl)asparagine amidase [Ceratina calcarata]